MNDPQLSDEQILEAALRCRTSVEIDVLLDQSCRGDRIKRRRIETRLDPSHTRTRATGDDDCHTREEHDLQISEVGSSIGPYKLEELIGEGGMGVVYRATQVTPVRREVAIKLIKPGLDTRQIIQRFEAERQALAMMDHPNIAHILDAGSTGAGRPYFVMELVDGQPITTYCDNRKLSLNQRLRLFCELCEAVQHAHHKGIIHRDLKPSNVLIVANDHKTLVRVIDFGLAKALQQKLTDQTLWTNYQNIIGTPLYMSPEQAEPLGLQVDTRSDVYSLGVMLYELLVGRTPFDAGEMSQASSETLRAILRDREPRRPSQRFAGLASEEQGQDLRPMIAARRHSDAHTWHWMLRGDLDWIVMKAIDRQRERRYDSPRALVDDINRFLRNEPVLASPPSALYRARKFTSRWRVPIAGALLVASVLIVATLVSLLFAREAIRLRAVAEQRTQSSLETAYSSDMRLASFALERGDCDQAVDLLQRWIPSSLSDDEQRDLRGVEWQLLCQTVMPPCELYPSNVRCAYSVCFSPDAKTLAVAGASGEILIFDSESHLVRDRIHANQGEVNGIAFSPDGTRLASAGDDGTIKVWEVATGNFVFQIQAHVGHAFQVAYSVDGTKIVSAGEGADFFVWDAFQGDRLGTFVGHTKTVEAIDISNCGRYVASVSSDSTGRIWDLETQTQLCPAQQLSGIGTAVRFSQDSTLLGFADLGGHATVVSVDRLGAADSSVYVAAHSEGVQSLDFFGRSNWLVTGDRGGVLRLWSPSPSSAAFGATEIDVVPKRSWKAHHHRIYGIASNIQGSSLISVCAGGNIRQWRLPEPTEHRDGQSPEFHAQQFAFLPDAVHAVGLTASGKAYYIDLHHSSKPEQLELPKLAWSRCAAVSDTLVAFGTTQGNQICLYNVPAKRVVAQRCFSSVDVHECEMRVSPNRRWMAISCQTQGVPAKLLNAQTLEPIADIPTNHSYDLQWQPHSDQLAVVSDHQIHLWDAQRQRLIRTLGSGTSPFKSLAFSRDGAFLAAAASDRSIHVWEIRTYSEKVIGRSIRNDPSSLAFSPDGQSLLAVDSHDGSILAWRTASWRFIGAPFRTLDIPVSLQFSPDGKTLGIVAVDSRPSDRFVASQSDANLLDLASPPSLRRLDSLR